LNYEKILYDIQGGKDASRLQPYYERMHNIYAELNEPDGMEGISTSIISPSIQHQIREHEMTGRWTSAQSCWEVQLQLHPEEPGSHLGLLRCLRNLGHYGTCPGKLPKVGSMCDV
jgi:serine/threonine-protein kinase ATR